jgi:hypothetical protein
MKSEFLLFDLPLMADIENARDNKQMGLINFKCYGNLNQKFSQTTLQDFYSYLLKEKFPVLRSFGLRMTVIFDSTYACEHSFSFMKTNESKYRSRLTDEHFTSIMTVVSSDISQRI